MYSKLFIIFQVLIVAVSAGIVAVPSVNVLQGPGSRTTLLGPDGSALDSEAPGGTVVVDGHAGLVPVGPAVLASGPEIAVRGPAGSVLTSYTAAGPAVVPAFAAGPAVVASPVVATGLAVHDGDDHSGDYIPDHAEALYDDGSYRGH